MNNALKNIILFGKKALWTPSKLATKVWLDSSDASTIVLNGSNVSQWRDKSGNNYHVSQSDAAYQPLIGVETLNGLQLINTDGYDQLSDGQIPLVSNNFTVFFVAKSDVTHQIDTQSTSGISGTTGQKFVTTPGNGGAVSRCGGGVSLGPNGISAYEHASSYMPAVAVYQEAFSGYNVFNGEVVSKKTSFYINGVKKHDGLTSPKDEVFIEGGIGSWYDSLDGNLAEYIIIAGNITQADRQKLEGYLAHKWGLKDKLPSDHPYKTNAPTV